MNSGSHHKLYDYEVAPPPGVWARIEAELDESELSRKFPSTLFNMESAPPALAWQKIAATLDEPALVQVYAAKLAGIEIAPPATAWEKIKTAIEPEPVQRIFSPWIKYAAAAAIIGLLVVGGTRLFNSPKNNNGIANESSVNPRQTNDPVKESIPVVDGELAIADMNAAIEEARDDAALEASKHVFAKLDVNAKRSKIKNAAGFAFSLDDEYLPTETVSTRGLPEFGDENTSAPPPGEPDLTSRYIVLMTPEGNIIRISKKLRNLVCCVSGEEMDKDCVDQLKKWREKIASPAAAHSPGNFLDLLHMLNATQEN